MAGWEVGKVGEVLNEVSIINMSQCVWPDVYQQGVVRYIKPLALQIAAQLTLLLCGPQCSVQSSL